MKKIFIMVFLLVTVFLPASETQNNLLLSFSLGNFRFSDSAASPLLYEGWTAMGAAAWILSSDCFSCETELHGAIGLMSSDVDYSSIEVVEPFVPNVDCGIETGVNTLFLVGENMFFGIGGLVGYNFNISFLTHINMYSWVGDLSFAPVVSLNYQLESGGRFYSRISIPLFSMLNRPSWTIHDDEVYELTSDSYILILFRGEPAWVNQYLKIKAEIGHDYYVADRLKFFTSGNIIYRHVKTMKTAEFLDIFLKMGMNYEF